MMKIIILISIQFLIYINSIAQNLVPNGDFEVFSSCPTGYGELEKATNWINPSSTNVPAADYFNPCCTLFNLPDLQWGYQTPHSGNSFAGFDPHVNYIYNYREYLEIQLLSPLKENTYYHFQMYISLANICNYTIDAIGVYFSDTLIDGINNNSVLPFTPQINNTSGNFITDTTWVLFKLDYVSKGGENYLIIGNFKDDVNIYTLSVNSSNWPDFTYFYVDDVALFECVSSVYNNPTNETNNLNIFPNPFSSSSTLQLTTQLKDAEVVISDMLGKEMMRKKLTGDRMEIERGSLESGVYFVRVRSEERQYVRKIVVE